MNGVTPTNHWYPLSVHPTHWTLPEYLWKIKSLIFFALPFLHTKTFFFLHTGLNTTICTWLSNYEKLHSSSCFFALFYYYLMLLDNFFLPPPVDPTSTDPYKKKMLTVVWLICNIYFFTSCHIFTFSLKKIKIKRWLLKRRIKCTNILLYPRCFVLDFNWINR